MAAVQGRHSKRRNPAKGTKRRELLIRLMRPAGLTAKEAVELGLEAQPSSLAATMERLYADYGFDVRRFSVPNPNYNPNQRGYRSFTHDPYCIR